MPALFVFLLKVNAALLLFCAGYYLVLRHLTFYTLNRVYLIGAIIFATVYPLINLDGFFQRHQQLAQPVYVVVGNLHFSEEVTAQPAYWNWLEVVFFAGVILLAVKLCTQLFSLYKVYKASRKEEIHGHDVRVVNGNGGPFSFWKSIYVNPTGYTESDLRAILKHEQIHTDEWHTLDILLAELSVIFYWFNPGVWLMRKAVRENIEFITDRKILQQGADTKQYQYSLLNVSFSNTKPGIANHFNISTLKKRILMMNAKRSSNLTISRYLLLVPVLLVLLLCFSVTRAAIVKTSKVTFTAIATSVDSIVKDNPVTNAVTNMFADSEQTRLVAKKGDTIKVIRVGKKDTVKIIGKDVNFGAVIMRDSMKGQTDYHLMNLMISDSADHRIARVRLNGKDYLPESARKFQIKADSILARVVFMKKDSLILNGQLIVHGEPVVMGGRGPINNSKAGFWTVFPADSLTSKKAELLKRLDVKVNSDGTVTQNGRQVVEVNGKPVTVYGTSISTNFSSTNMQPDSVKRVKALLQRMQGFKVASDGSVSRSNGVNNFLGRQLANAPTKVMNFTVKGYAAREINIDSVGSKLMFIDGKEATEKQLKKLPISVVQSLRVERGPEAVKQYGDKAKNGVVFITTKKDN